MNWLELKEFIQQRFNESTDLQIKNSFEEILNKMNELESQDTFLAYTCDAGRELLQNAKPEDEVSVWTEFSPNSIYKVRVHKNAVVYYDEELKAYDCKISGVQLLGEVI
jgi:hypothetical protein